MNGPNSLEQVVPDADSNALENKPSSVRRLKILVLGTDSRAFLTVVRSLGRAGHEIHVAWAANDSVALFSRYISKRHELSRYRANDEAWLRELQELLAENAIDLVIPCADPMIIPLQAVQSQLRTKARLDVLPDDLYRIANSKIEMYRIAQELEIPVARGVIASCADDAQTALRSLRGPWVFKPDYSYFARAFETRNTVRKAYTMEEATQLISRFVSRGRFHVQENFIGTGAGIEVLCNRGEILLAFQHIRVHEPLHGGGSSYRRGTPVHPGMLDATRKLMARLQYTGVTMAEFKWDQASGHWIFVELNARFWGSLPLAVASGADFPRALVELLMFGKRPVAYNVRNDLYGRNIELDVDWLISNIWGDKNDPTLSTLPWNVVLRELLNVFRGKERWDTLVLDDPRPFFGEIVAILGVKSNSLVRRIVCSEIYLTALRSRRRRLLRDKLLDAKRIGFVCHGNICRSPFAESWARTKISGVSFFSAGFHDLEDRRVPDTAHAAAKVFNIDLARHRSSRLTPRDARAADVLFVFDRKNLRHMHMSFPDAMAKTFLISDLTDEARLEIADPWNHELGVFVETYRTIQFCINAMPNC